MDVHRIRYVPYNPSPINCVAFSQSTAPSKKQQASPVRLAIGRASGDIEIWNPLGGSWHQETIIRGGKDRTVDGLVWVTEPDQILELANQEPLRIPGRLRLFSFGYSSTITEWDLERGCPKHQSGGTHGDIWCLGVQPFTVLSKKGDKSTAKVYPTGKKLVAGTIDGSLVLYDIDDGGLRYDRVLIRASSKKTKMVSIAFQSRNVVVVGTSQSCILVYDMRNGTTLAKMTLGSDLSGGAREIIAWCVKCLPGGDIVSGDSTGELRVWDGKTYTQAQRLKAHSSDILSLVASADGSTIVTGGMDRKTAVFRKTTVSSTRWAKIFHSRLHHHDVKTMASFEGHGMSVVVSGGPDATPIVMPLERAGVENHRLLSSLPQEPPLQSACGSRLIISWWDRQVSIWRLEKSLSDLEGNLDKEQGIAKNRKLVARVLIKGEANITSASISPDGSLLIVSTTLDIKAFHLQPRHGTRWDELKISKVEIDEKLASHGATRTLISPNGEWVCLIQAGGIVSLLKFYETPSESGKPRFDPKPIRLHRLQRKISKQASLGGFGQYDRTITHLAFSPNSDMLAVADLAGFIDTWVYGGARAPGAMTGKDDDVDASDTDDDSSESDNDDTEKEEIRWRRNPNASLIPRLQAAPTVLSFQPLPATRKLTLGEDNEQMINYTLLAVTAKPQILLIHPFLGELTEWTRRNPIQKFPTQFRNIRDLVKGALWVDDRIWLYGNTYLWMFDLSQDLAEPKTGKELVKQGTKRKRGPDSGAGNRVTTGASGPTKIIRHLEEGTVEEDPLDGPIFDPMDEDETSGAAGDSDSDESEDEIDGDLALLRDHQNKSSLETETKRGPAFWNTFKYRPILGIVPLRDWREAREASGQANGDSTASSSLEVALVERPLWDVDIPDRYFGEGEFE
ncbi:WD40 repeat-like protein [Xylariaceae sp. FL1019]|nr:WD40 repeat-like protein [Xylariaceae sp. FL1019]